MDTQAQHRPNTWDEYVGQTRLKERLEVHIAAACASTRPVDHILLTGPPGVGKTTLAQLVAHYADEDLVSTIAPIKPNVLQRLALRHQGILFIDEIHRMKTADQETLLPLIEDGYMILPNGRKQFSSWLTIIGATTEQADIIPPLYDRFPIKPLFEAYSPDEMAQMIAGLAKRLGVELNDELIIGLADAAGGIPRNARNLTFGARALIETGKELNVEAVLGLMGVTKDGLSDQHVEYLRALDALGGTAGLTPMTTILRLHPKVVMELERMLVDKELVTFTSKGRELTPDGFKALEAA